MSPSLKFQSFYSTTIRFRVTCHFETCALNDSKMTLDSDPDTTMSSVHHICVTSIPSPKFQSVLLDDQPLLRYRTFYNFPWLRRYSCRDFERLYGSGSFGVIWCTFLKIACNSRTAGRKTKRRTTIGLQLTLYGSGNSKKACAYSGKSVGKTLR